MTTKMMQKPVSGPSSEHPPRKHRVTLTVSLVGVLVLVAVGKDLRLSWRVTHQYVPSDTSPVFWRHETECSNSSLVDHHHHSSTFRSSPHAPHAVRLISSPEEIHTRDSFHRSALDPTDRVPAAETLVWQRNPDALSQDRSRKLAAAERDAKNLHYAYQDVTEMQARSTRFPSVVDRVKLYMSNWYTPPCAAAQDDGSDDDDDDDDARVGFAYVHRRRHNSTTTTSQILTLREIAIPPRTRRIWQLDSHFNGSAAPGSFDQVHFMDRNTMLACQHRYCRDVVAFLFPALKRVGHSGLYSSVPILFQFGDDNRTQALRWSKNKETKALPPPLESYPQIPVLKKMRQCLTKSELERITEQRCYGSGERRVPNHSHHLEPVVMKLKTQRHYGRIKDIATWDVAWDVKKNAAIFRGKLTGNYPVPYYTNEGNISEATVHERCRLLERCWIVYQHVAKNSTLVDAKLTLPFTPNNRKLIPRFLALENGGDTADSLVDLYADTVSLSEMLQYKALIMLEGNDVSSGLKWALFSNSVVMMPEPTLISWAMEERLEPWVHYVPIHVDTRTPVPAATDVEQKMQWIVDHDDQARQIARAGKLWIADLVLHPAVPQEEAAVLDEILRRYATHFVPASVASY